MTSREDKLKAIGLSTSYKTNMISNKALDELYNKTISNKDSHNDTHKDIQKKKRDNTIISKSKCAKVADDDLYYIVTLNFINKLLESMKKPKINKLTEFINIDKDNIITDECKQILSNELPNIVLIFGKLKINYRQKDTLKNYVVYVIKKMIYYCGYTLKTYNYTKTKKMDTEKFNIKRYTEYSVLD